MRAHSTVEEGAEAVFHLATSSELNRRLGTFLDGRGGPRPPATYNSRERQRLREVAFELTGNRSTSPIEEGSSSSPNFRLRQLRARCLLAFLAKPFEVGAHERDLSLQAARRVAQHIDRGFGIPQALLRFGVVIVGQYRCDAGQS